MKRFVALYQQLDATTRSTRKRAALAQYFREAPPADAAHAIAVLCGQRPRRGISSTRLRQIVAETVDLPEWLVAESHHQVGDLAETLALLLPPPTAPQDWPLAHWMSVTLPDLRRGDEAAQATQLQALWAASDLPTRFVMHKLLMGGFRVGVARQTVVHALADALQQPAEQIAARLMGQIPTDAGLLQRLASAERPEDSQMPFPFLLAHPLPAAVAETFNSSGVVADDITPDGVEGEAADSGDAAVKSASSPAWRVTDFAIEPKWDGIRVQIVRRRQVSLWSRGEEEMSAAFPELVTAAERLPVGTTLDGELLAWKPENAGAIPRVAPFGQLQRRLNRKTASARLQKDVPVGVLVFDLLEADGVDLRDQPWSERRTRLESVLAETAGPESGCLQLAPVLPATTGADVARLRDQVAEQGAEGLMLKQRDSRYAVGRPRGLWWKWKRDPRTLDGVLVYAQAGHGRRAGLHTDLTLAVWQGEELVPIAKAYSGLSDAEFRQLDQWIRKHTLERFGPVRRVPPAQVFEIAFEGINRSTRHKAGLALRFPRIVRWRHDKSPEQADTLDHLQSVLIDAQTPPRVAPGRS